MQERRSRAQVLSNLENIPVYHWDQVYRWRRSPDTHRSRSFMNRTYSHSHSELARSILRRKSEDQSHTQQDAFKESRNLSEYYDNLKTNVSTQSLQPEVKQDQSPAPPCPQVIHTDPSQDSEVTYKFSSKRRSTVAESPEALRTEILELRKKSIRPVKLLPGKPLLKQLILSTVGKLEVGKLVPRHCLSTLLLSSLVDKSLIYCDVPPLQFWDFVDKVAGMSEPKSETLCSRKKGQSLKKKEIVEQWKLNLDMFQRQGYPNMPSRIKFLSKEEISKTIAQYFGTGKKRTLRPGEGAILLKEVKRLIAKMHTNPEILLNNVSAIVKTLLGNANLVQLGAYPLCMKQIVAVWKICITREVMLVDQSKIQTPHKKKFYRTLPHAVARGHLLTVTMGKFKMPQVHFEKM